MLLASPTVGFDTSTGRCSDGGEHVELEKLRVSILMHVTSTDLALGPSYDW